MEGSFRQRKTKLYNCHFDCTFLLYNCTNRHQLRTEICGAKSCSAVCARFPNSKPWIRFLQYECLDRHSTSSVKALRGTERIEYKLLSLTYKVLTTTQPPYLHKLISVQRPRSTRASTVVTLARPPIWSTLKITDRSFRYALPCLWNQLSLFLRQRHSAIWYQFLHFLLKYSFTHYFFLFWYTTLLIHNSLSLSLPA